MTMDTTKGIKYPRTAHLPESKGMTSDDKMGSAQALAYLDSGIELSVSIKMDGGNISMMRDNFYGRSLDSGTHAWDQQAKALWAKIRLDIPEGWRLSGESMYARRSIAYENLPGIYLLFGIWDETNTLLSWDDTIIWAEMLGLPMVETIYRGTSFKDAREAWAKNYSPETSEGFVVRDAGRIAYKDFPNKALKFVRASHVTTRADWRHRDDFALNTFVNSKKTLNEPHL
jgi:hypothetical protein